MAKTRKLRKGVTKKEKPCLIPTREELNNPPNTLEDYVIALFGEKGIGKTTLASQFDDFLVCMWEPGRRNLKVRQFPYKPGQKLTYAVQKEIIQQGCKDPTIKGFAIDTIDRLYNAAVEEMCFDRGISSPSEMNDFGALWREIRDDVEATLSIPREYGKGLILLSHAKEKELETASGDKYCRVVPTCGNAAFEIMKAMCDYAWYYGFVGKKRCLQLRGDDHIWSACGVSDHFQDSIRTNEDGDPMDLERIYLPSPKSAYKLLLAAFNNELTEQIEGEEETPKKKKKKLKRIAV